MRKNESMFEGGLAVIHMVIAPLPQALFAPMYLGYNVKIQVIFKNVDLKEMFQDFYFPTRLLHVCLKRIETTRR